LCLRGRKKALGEKYSWGQRKGICRNFVSHQKRLPVGRKKTCREHQREGQIKKKGSPTGETSKKKKARVEGSTKRDGGTGGGEWKGGRRGWEKEMTEKGPYHTNPLFVSNGKARGKKTGGARD